MHTGQIIHRPLNHSASLIPPTRTIEFPIGATVGAGGSVQHRLSAMRETADSRPESVRAHGG